MKRTEIKRSRAGTMKQTALQRYAKLKPGGFASKNKYNAVRTHSALWNKTFDSGLECRYADHLFARWKNGEIDKPEPQVGVDLIIGGVKLARWKVDFKYFEHRFCGHHTEYMVWDEVKGRELGDYRLKRNLWSAGAGPGLLRVTKARRSSKVEPWSWTEYWPAKIEPQYCKDCDWQVIESAPQIRWCGRCGALEQKLHGLWEIIRPSYAKEKDNG